MRIRLGALVGLAGFGLFLAPLAQETPRPHEREQVEQELSSVVLSEGTLTIALPSAVDRCALEASEAGLVVRWESQELRFPPEKARNLRAVHSTTHLRLTGNLESEAHLALEGPRLEIAGALSAPSLLLRSSGWLEVTARGSLCAPAGRIALEADVLSIVGPVRAEGGGEIQVSARNMLHAATLSANATSRAPAGRIVVGCERYIGTVAGVAEAISPQGQGGSIRLEASVRVFSSGRFDATGARGGQVWLSGADTRLVAATLDASGVLQGGEVRVGAESDEALPDGRNRWHAGTLVATAATRFRASSAGGSGGAVVLGSRRATHFAGRVEAWGRHGRGGRVEVSSSRELVYDGHVEATGSASRGELLLDPQNLVLDDTLGVLARYSLVDPNPNLARFGGNTLALSGGNVVVTDDLDDMGASSAGAAYLYDGATGALISTLLGSTANDQVGLSSLKALVGNGNYVVRSPNWSNGAAAQAGAATWGNGLTGVSGAVTNANSLVGTTAGDRVSFSGTQPLTNGNYVVESDTWDDGPNVDVGAATWCNGASGTSGEVSTANSLYGTTNDRVASAGVTALSNGNYVVSSPAWAGNVGAATWGNGATGQTGPVTAANSFVGATGGDQIGSLGAIALTNGNYVVASPMWTNGFTSAAGAATWGNGATGSSGTVALANSLVGTTLNDRVSGGGVTALSNGNYVVLSWEWDNGSITQAGAATWGNGASGSSGAVGIGNSLVGTTAFDSVSRQGAIALTNGNYVVVSRSWDGAAADVGAVTWGNGTTGISGAVGSGNSLVGTRSNDDVGGTPPGAVALTNGNYVVLSRAWNNGLDSDVGAVTWGNGTTGISGPVGVGNSLVGTRPFDSVGSSGVTALTNGNYVVGSQGWNNGLTSNTGAVTWGNGTTGISGPVGVGNSLVGTTANDLLASAGIQALTNGNYVVRSPGWNNGAVSNAGAATWGNGATGTVGVVAVGNSLVGTTAFDRVSEDGVTALTDGNYVVVSKSWDNGATTDAGAMTLGDGSQGSGGAVSTANSLVGDGVATVLRAETRTSSFVGTFVGFNTSIAFPLEQTTFALGTGQTISSPTARITQLLSAGTNVTLQASQDITISSPIVVNNPGGAGGNLTLIAGRNVVINANVTTDDGNLTVVSNATLADGVVDADRGAGSASVQNSATIDTGGGTLRFETRDGAGLTNNARSDYVLGTITAGSTVIVPFVTSLTPTTATSADTVTIVGGGLSGATVTVGGVAATIVTATGSQVTMNFANTTPTGSQPVTLTTASGSIALGNVTVNAGPAPAGGGGVPLPGGGGTTVTKTGDKSCALATPSGHSTPLAFGLLLVALMTLRRRSF